MGLQKHMTLKLTKLLKQPKRSGVKSHEGNIYLQNTQSTLLHNGEIYNSIINYKRIIPWWLWADQRNKWLWDICRNNSDTTSGETGDIPTHCVGN